VKCRQVIRDAKVEFVPFERTYEFLAENDNRASLMDRDSDFAERTRVFSLADNHLWQIAVYRENSVGEATVKIVTCAILAACFSVRKIP
jgi:hypothetical protein